MLGGGTTSFVKFPVKFSVVFVLRESAAYKHSFMHHIYINLEENVDQKNVDVESRSQLFQGPDLKY